MQPPELATSMHHPLAGIDAAAVWVDEDRLTVMTSGGDSAGCFTEVDRVEWTDNTITMTLITRPIMLPCAAVGRLYTATFDVPSQIDREALTVFVKQPSGALTRATISDLTP